LNPKTSRGIQFGIQFETRKKINSRTNAPPGIAGQISLQNSWFHSRKAERLTFAQMGVQATPDLTGFQKPLYPGFVSSTEYVETSFHSLSFENRESPHVSRKW
jgi:hypothetical protein